MAAPIDHDDPRYRALAEASLRRHDRGNPGVLPITTGAWLTLGEGCLDGFQFTRDNTA